jgi:hypothetical protein
MFIMMAEELSNVNDQDSFVSERTCESDIDVNWWHQHVQNIGQRWWQKETFFKEK